MNSQINTEQREKSAYPVLFNNINNDYKLSIILAEVDEGHPSDLNISLEWLQTQNQTHETEQKYQKTILI